MPMLFKTLMQSHSHQQLILFPVHPFPGEAVPVQGCPLSLPDVFSA